ncbi:hypothetical protein ES703_70203 [subsurface metagenome]
MENQKQYKVLKVHIKNFKGIEDLTMDVNGQHVILIGDNELCKSSATDAIWTTLSAKRIPQQPIREGTDKAEVIVIIGNDEVQYQIERKYTEKGSYLEITSPEGFKSSKIANLTNLVGDVDFNVFEFIELGKTVPGRREQIGIIREFLNDKTIKILDENSLKIVNIKESRTGLNVRLRDLKGLINTGNENYNFEDAEKFSKPVDLNKIHDEYQKAIDHNSAWKQFVIKWCPGLESPLVGVDEITGEIDKSISELQTKIVELSVEREKIINFKQTDVLKLRTEFEAAKEHNNKVDQVKIHLEHKDEFEKKMKEYDKWGVEIKRIEIENKKLITESEIPVDGLTFDEDGLYLNGLPFTEEQLATSQLMDAGVDIRIAKKPKVAIVRISHGESYGEKRFKELIESCNKRGYQLFIEKVDSTKKELKLQYFNDIKDLK